jgi:hypothetical protein
MAAILYHCPVEITIFYAGLNNIMCAAGPFYALSNKLSAKNGPFVAFAVKTMDNFFPSHQ